MSDKSFEQKVLTEEVKEIGKQSDILYGNLVIIREKSVRIF